MKKYVILSHSAIVIFAIMSSSSAYAETVFSKSNVLGASALLEKHAELKDKLSQNQYGRPLFIESMESADSISSTAYAVLDSPFPVVNATFRKPNLWCEVLILHINTKYCHANTDGNSNILTVNVGKKTAQPLSEGFLIKFSHQLMEASSNFMVVQLHAEQGPLSTTDYRIEFQAVALPEGKTFMNFRYSYGYSLAGRLAMQAYLTTIGRGKIGFTKVTQQTSKLGFVSGMRGAVERNAMRYFLAIEAYLSSLKQLPAQQLSARLQYWFDATEQYPQQLHEVDRSSYLAMKKAEHQRQQTSLNSTK